MFCLGWICYSDGSNVKLCTAYMLQLAERCNCYSGVFESEMLGWLSIDLSTIAGSRSLFSCYIWLFLLTSAKKTYIYSNCYSQPLFVRFFLEINVREVLSLSNILEILHRLVKFALGVLLQFERNVSRKCTTCTDYGCDQEFFGGTLVESISV